MSKNPDKSADGTAGIDHPGYLLRRLGAAFRRRMDERLRRGKSLLSMAQMAVLARLAEEPGASGAQLARRTLISAQAISTVLRRLASDGFILRASHPDNKRSGCWQLTGKGTNALLRAGRAAEPIMKQMQSSLSAGEQVQLVKLLKRCIAALEAD